MLLVHRLHILQAVVTCPAHKETRKLIPLAVACLRACCQRIRPELRFLLGCCGEPPVRLLAC